MIYPNLRSPELLPLFKGVSRDEAEHVYRCFGGYVKEYKKGEIVISEGDLVNSAGVILEGEARSLKTDVSGKQFIVTILKRGNYIGILLATSPEAKSPVTVEATDRLTVLFLPYDKLTGRCQKNCSAHSQVLKNFIGGISEKAMLLHERNDCLIKPTVREKILTYLNATRRAKNIKNSAFEIPFDRQEMADYLNVDRSALSRELSKMKKDGIIDFYKSGFKILPQKG